MKTLEVVLSGFFDTIGLYTNSNDYQKRHALEWLKIFQLQQFKNTAFDDLSFGIQRLIFDNTCNGKVTSYSSFRRTHSRYGFI